MAITLNSDYISGNVGVGKTPAYALDVNGNLRATAYQGNGSNISGLVKEFEYYAHERDVSLSIGGTAKNARTLISSAPAGDYWVFGNCNWKDNVAPNNDEDAAQFYIYGSNGTTNRTSGISREIDINGGGQRGFQGMIFSSRITLTSTGTIYLYFNNFDGDTDSGGFGGWTSWIAFKRA